MYHRRILGSITGLLVLQIVLVGSGAICPEHWLREDRSATATIAGATHHHDGRVPHRQHGPAELPTLPDCCQSMTTCTANIALAAVESQPFLDLGHHSAIASLFELATSHVETPDPPPPKA